MNVTGVIVAASEIMRFEKGSGIILTVHNHLMNFSFYVFPVGDFVHFWKEVSVCKYYKFSYLKFGAIELVSGLKKMVLLATAESTFEKIEESQIGMFNVLNSVKRRLIVSNIVLKTELHPFSQIISYQGVITAVKSQKLGLYELDCKIYLYCIFNCIHALLPLLEENHEVFVSNAHFFKDHMGRKILVCCGLSSVRLIQETDEVLEEENHLLNCNLHHYLLGIYDVIWLEMFMSNLNLKFNPFLIETNAFNLESNIINNILQYFSDPFTEQSSSRQSLGDDYCSNPHSCNVFCQDKLPTGCEVPLISDIIDCAYSLHSWTENSKNWKIKCVQNHTNRILVGFLFYSKDNSWFIKDISSSVPIVLSPLCNECSFEKDILCSFRDISSYYIVAIQNFEIIFEKIKLKNDKYDCYHYFRTSCCCLFKLEEYVIYNNMTSAIYSQKEDLLIPIKEINHMLEKTHLDKNGLFSGIKYSGNSESYPSTENINAVQRILILSKIWTLINKRFVCYQILALILPEEKSCNSFMDSSKCLFEDSCNYYETDDDIEFAELVDSMDSLFLKDNHIVRLHFESAKQCITMLPGHIFEIHDDDVCRDFDSYIYSRKADGKPLLVKIKPSTKMIHSAMCSGSHFKDYDSHLFCDIEEIISDRKQMESSLIRAVLVDKSFEDSIFSCSSESEETEKMTFCLTVKDCNTAATMRVYLRFCPKNMFGFLNGITLQMYGFVCVCSKRGYLYLRTSSAFGISIINFKYPIEESGMLQSSSGNSEDLQLAYLSTITPNKFFKCLSFITKLLSARIGWICNNCRKDFEDKCACFVDYSSKLDISFLIDDGFSQGIATANDETALKILLFSEKEWSLLISSIFETKTSLKFNHETIDADIRSSPVVNRLFCAYCSSKCFCRRVLLVCRKKSGGFKANTLQAVWCSDVLKLSEMDLIPELMSKVKNIGLALK